MKSVGDAVILTSPDPAGGIALVQRLFDAFAGESNFPLPRAGLHHGPAVERAGDFFGSTINIAAWVAAQASAGQVLATSPMAKVAQG